MLLKCAASYAQPVVFWQSNSTLVCHAFSSRLWLLSCVATAVSDMANGGQVLMESSTADVVRAWLTDLGAVDHKGYNDKLLTKSSRNHTKEKGPPAFRCAHRSAGCAPSIPDCWQQQVLALLQLVAASQLYPCKHQPCVAPCPVFSPCWLWQYHQHLHLMHLPSAVLACTYRFLSSCLSSAMCIVSHDRDAILLNMGQYWISGLVSTIHAVTEQTGKHNTTHTVGLGVLRGRRSVDSSDTHQHTASTKPVLQLQGSGAAIAAASAAAAGSSSAEASLESLQLYSILARPLHARCKVWRGKLLLPQGAQQIAKGYFAAPGELCPESRCFKSAS